MARAIAKTEGRRGATGKSGGKSGGKNKGERRRAPAPLRRDTSAAIQSGRTAVRIRPVEQWDGAALANLRRQNEHAHARLLPDYFRVAPDPAVAEPKSSATMDPSSVILVAEKSGLREDPIRGYVSLKVVDTPRDPAMTPRRRAHVDEIVVDEGHRGGGIGTALMHAAAGWARRRGAVELVLTVWSDNRGAERLYERLGFQPIARVLRRKLDP